MEILTLDAYREAIRNDRIIVITDSATGNRAHAADCSFVSLDNFKAKVLESQRRDGAYYAVSSVREARRDHGATVCNVCSPS